MNTFMLLYLVVLWIKKTFYSLPKLYLKLVLRKNCPTTRMFRIKLNRDELLQHTTHKRPVLKLAFVLGTKSLVETNCYFYFEPHLAGWGQTRVELFNIQIVFEIFLKAD